MNSKIIRTRIGLALPNLFKSYNNIKEHPQISEVFPEYLIILYQIIRTSVPLMENAFKKSKTLRNTDPIANMLCDYFEEHIEEERDHDKWLLEDLESINMDSNEVKNRLPLPSIAAMVGAQSYWIDYYHPYMLLGHIVISEGYPPSKDDIIKLSSKTNLPITCFRTLNKHAELDVMHSRELDNFLDKVPFTKESISNISVSGMTTIRFAIEAFTQLVNRHSSFNEVLKYN